MVNEKNNFKLFYLPIILGLVLVLSMILILTLTFLDAYESDYINSSIIAGNLTKTQQENINLKHTLNELHNTYSCEGTIFYNYERQWLWCIQKECQGDFCKENYVTIEVGIQ